MKQEKDKIGNEAIVLTIVLLVLALVILLSGCSRTVYMPVETIKTEYKDRIISDSIGYKEILNIRDSFRIKDSTVIILNDQGDIVRKEVYYWKERYLASDYQNKIWKSRYDSLLNVKNEKIREPYPVEKKLTKWQQFKMDVGGISIGIVVALVLIIIFLLLGKKKGGRLL